MKKIEAFMNRSSAFRNDGLKELVEVVNDYIKKLNSNGITDVTILPTLSSDTVIYTLVWEEPIK